MSRVFPEAAELQDVIPTETVGTGFSVENLRSSSLKGETLQGGATPTGFPPAPRADEGGGDEYCGGFLPLRIGRLK